MTNEELKIKIMQMLEQRYALASEIAFRLDITTQKAMALLLQLQKEQKVQRLKVNDKTLWGVVE